MHVKCYFRLHVSQYKLREHMVGLAFQFVLRFSCSVDLFIPLFVMYFHICSLHWECRKLKIMNSKFWISFVAGCQNLLVHTLTYTKSIASLFMVEQV